MLAALWKNLPNKVNHLEWFSYSLGEAFDSVKTSAVDSHSEGRA